MRPGSARPPRVEPCGFCGVGPSPTNAVESLTPAERASLLRLILRLARDHPMILLAGALLAVAALAVAFSSGEGADFPTIVSDP